jgi:hypothetical protein
MPQHMPYKLPEDGYYYFRPYHYAHIAIQQDFVSGFGGDRRNPYAFEIFNQLETEELPGPAVPPQDPSPTLPPLHDPRPSPQSMRSSPQRDSSIGKRDRPPYFNADQLGIAWTRERD